MKHVKSRQIKIHAVKEALTKNKPGLSFNNSKKLLSNEHDAMFFGCVAPVLC
jgi:hypothetical protein